MKQKRLAPKNKASIVKVLSCIKYFIITLSSKQQITFDFSYRLPELVAIGQNCSAFILNGGTK